MSHIVNKKQQNTLLQTNMPDILVQNHPSTIHHGVKMWERRMF